MVEKFMTAKHILSKNTLAMGVTAAALFSLMGCGSDNAQIPGENSVQERRPGTTTGSWQDSAQVSSALGADKAVRINARTNYITYYENGVAKSKWKIATGRPGYESPKGIFAIHIKDVCPPWSRNGASAGPCAPDNPLGKKALWFHQGYTYGMHGVDWGHITSVTASNPRDRDQSSGCVRNHPENIEWLFARVSVGTPVVSGAWDTDPQVVDCSGNAARCSGGPDGPGSPTNLPTWCAVQVREVGGFANVRSAANTSSEVIDVLDGNSKVRIVRKLTGESVGGSSDWYAIEYTLGGPKSGFIHSSLIDENCRP
jgi:hypothetical protein